jgi:hypothetical protein
MLGTLTGSVMCHAILEPHHLCLLLLGAVVQMCMHTYIIYCMADSSSILVSITPLLSAHFTLDLLLTRLNEKILTFFSIALDIFSIIIGRFIPCSIIVRMGSGLKISKCYSVLKPEEVPGFQPCPLRGTP